MGNRSQPLRRREDRFINFRPRPGDSTWLQARGIYALLEDQSGNLWLGALGAGGGVVIRGPAP